MLLCDDLGPTHSQPHRKRLWNGLPLAPVASDAPLVWVALADECTVVRASRYLTTNMTAKSRKTTRNTITTAH